MSKLMNFATVLNRFHNSLLTEIIFPKMQTKDNYKKKVLKTLSLFQSRYTR
jgi:hypothetical protein